MPNYNTNFSSLLDNVFSSFIGPEYIGYLMSVGAQQRAESLLSRTNATGSSGAYGGGDPIGDLMTQGAKIRAQAQSTLESAGSAISGLAGGNANAGQWTDLVKKVANEIGIPAKNIAAIMKIESGGKQNATSPAGAMGLMQIMPFHFSGGEDPYDPYTNIKRGAEILAKNLSSYGSWDKAAAAYFGAIDASGNITGAQDVLGTGGYKYVQMFNDALSQQPAGGGYNENYTFPVEHYAGEIEPHWGELKAKGGTDIFAPEGTPVMSMVRGTIEDAGYSDIGGNYVTLRGDDGQAYYYAHMKDRPAVGMGQTVGPGTTLGQVGATGNAVGTPPHLHIGIGSDIEEGVGAFGGLGTDFDALTFLRSLLG